MMVCPALSRCIIIICLLSLEFILVHAAPTHIKRYPKKEQHCSHASSETLCWTVRLQKPQNIKKTYAFYKGTSDTSHLLHSSTSKDEQEELLKYQNVYSDLAHLLAKDVGLTVLGKVGEFYDHFLLCHKGSENQGSSLKAFQDYHKVHSALQENDSNTFTQVKAFVEEQLEAHHDVAWFNMELVHQRQKRSLIFNDPFFSKQWHLVNQMEDGMDINVTGVWEQGITGTGVTVAVVDDGLEWTNPDLHYNYNLLGSWDLNDNDPDPMPSTTKASNHHGTRCAGEIAAIANNSICGLGVAFGAKVSGIRLLDGPMTDSLEAEAFNKKFDINAVYSCSWGPDDDGKTVDGPHILAAKAMKYGVDFGRHGYGSIFVVASGNGGSKKDNCNYDGYANSIYTVTIGAVDESGAMPYYAEECASMLGVTFSSGIANKRDIVTTDWTKGDGTGCTDQHTGTSAAAPLVAGMVALMLHARPCLTWRDVQYIIIITSVKIDVDLAHWQKNGAGLEHSHKHGFGLIKAWRLVNAARVWRPVPWMTSFSCEDSTGWVIPRGDDSPLTVTHTVSASDIAGYSLYLLEYVQVTVSLTHPNRGKLGINFLCPSGTESIIGAPRPNDNSSEGFTDWTFTTVRCWGEEPTGNWTLLIYDEVPDDKDIARGRLLMWRITLFGTPITTSDFQQRRREVEEAMSGKYLSPNYTPTCEPPPVTSPPYIPLSEKTLKILVLASAFCLIFAVYETFEYMLCYGEEKRQKAEEVQANRSRPSSNTNSHTNDDVAETTGLLVRQESVMDGVQNGVQLDADHDSDDDMFSMDDFFTAGRNQTLQSLNDNKHLEQREAKIKRAPFVHKSGTLDSGNFASEQDEMASADSENTSEWFPLTKSRNGANNVDGTREKIPTSHKSKKHGNPVRKSILPQLWQALTQNSRGLDKEELEDEIFSHDASRTPLLAEDKHSSNTTQNGHSFAYKNDLSDSIQDHQGKDETRQ